MSTFQVGQEVTAVDSFGWCITKNQTYTILEVIPEFHDFNGRFTYPEYVKIADDFGDICVFYPWRFRAKETSECATQKP